MKKDLISINDLSREEMQELFNFADRIEKNEATVESQDNKVERRLEKFSTGKTMAKLFFEPSTRTTTSFELAMLNLGGKVVGFNNPEASSVSKGESLADTAKIYDGFIKKSGGGLIVVRHPLSGAAQIMADYADSPVINAGDGDREHPTQTLIDLYTIQKMKNRIDGLTIGVLGDLKHSRAIKSLMLGLNQFKDIKFFIGSASGLGLDKNFLEQIKHEVRSELKSNLLHLDVLYVVRIKKERFASHADYEAVKGEYSITHELMEQCKDDMLLMHPLPRVDEIAKEVDKDPRAVYFEQAANGIPLRMALISTLLHNT